jgi:hypothetical protein
MATAGFDLDDVRSTFRSWVIFRSDTGSFYATRCGERLSFAQIRAGLQQTVCADDLSSFVSLLREQEERRDRS